MSDYKQFVANRRLESYDVYVGRPSKWGNPFSHLKSAKAQFKVATRDEAVEKYRAWLLAQPELVAAAKKELRGKVLGCWCKPARCHAEVLAEIANEPLKEVPLYASFYPSELSPVSRFTLQLRNDLLERHRQEAKQTEKS